MEIKQSNCTSSLILNVKTGDLLGAGTDADVKIILHGETSKSAEINLDLRFINDHEKGKTYSYDVAESDYIKIGPIKKIELWTKGFSLNSDWFVEKIWIGNKQSPEQFIFPILRWIKKNKHYYFSEYDTYLPQFDENSERRKEELKHKRKLYQYIVREPGLPAQIKQLPDDESFYFEDKWNLVTTRMKLIIGSKIINFISPKWSSLEDLETVYKLEMDKPTTVNKWKDDLWFGAQRIQGCNPVLIKLCTEIPEKFGVDRECLEKCFPHKSLQEMLEAKQLFITDLEILDKLDLPVSDKKLCSPIALFYLDDKKCLKPAAIQLFQQKGPDNPVFYPSDPAWLLAKMWYNNADASYHQSLTHFGFTHLLMEGVAICSHRNLSLSHPLFKILAPHFHYLLAINTRGIEKLVSVNGWVDETMTIGRSGMFEIIKRGVKRWRMDIDGTFPNDINARGVDKTVLPHYPYRDDGLLVYEAISKYVSTIVHHHYDDLQKITDDYELQSFAHELSLAKDQGGLGIKGVPGGGAFKNKEDIIKTITSIIFTCSAGHAAANFLQYDDYAFPPNYPSVMKGEIPKKTQKRYTDKDVINQLPDKKCTLSVMVVTKLLSERATQALGDFEVQYIYDPVGVAAVKEFRKDLKEISDIIRQRNKERSIPYTLLDPETIPNAISI